MDEMSKGNDDVKARCQENENAMKTLETKVTRLQANQNCGEFLWCIQDWNEKRERARNGIDTIIYSDPFYSHRNGYKMRLRLCPDGYGKDKGTNLSLYICIMQGEFDNILQWPFRHDLKLELMNQETGLAHISKIVKPEDNLLEDSWKKPDSKENAGYGFYEFIKQSDLLFNAALLQDNQIWIKVTPHVKPELS